MIVFVLLACDCAACKPNPVQPVSDGGVDASIAPPGTSQTAYARMDEIGQACEVLRFLKCPEATPEAGTCEVTMGKLVSIGTFERGNVLCIRQSRTVEKVRTCSVDCAQ